MPMDDARHRDNYWNAPRGFFFIFQRRQGAAIGGSGLLQAFVRDRQLILQHFLVHTSMITETRRQSGRAIQVHAMRRVLHLEAQGRAWVAST